MDGGRGQAAVETAIVLPALVFFILGFLQLTLLHQARLVLEYAAFGAARAGAVWNADHKVMVDAATFVLVPTFGLTSSQSASGPIHGAQDVPTLARTYASFIRARDRGTSAGPSILRVDTLNPTQDALAGSDEVDFDDPDQRTNTQLTVRVAYLFNLRIPFANWILFQTFMAQRAAVELVRRVDGWYTGQTQVSSLRSRLGLTRDAAPSDCAYSGFTTRDYRSMVAAAEGGTFLLPLVTTYTLRMQSNPLSKNLSSRADVFPEC